MRTAAATKFVKKIRRINLERLAGFVFAIEQSKRICFQTALAIRAKFFLFVLVIILELAFVGRTAYAASDGIDFQNDILDFEISEKPVRQQNYFGVVNRVIRATHYLESDLRELPKPA